MVVSRTEVDHCVEEVIPFRGGQVREILKEVHSRVIVGECASLCPQASHSRIHSVFVQVMRRVRSKKLC